MLGTQFLFFFLCHAASLVLALETCRRRVMPIKHRKMNELENENPYIFFHKSRVYQTNSSQSILALLTVLINFPELAQFCFKNLRLFLCPL
uniref:Putative secreted protein n=1 Tax=Ixodes scapularis TaxID=6945 RepID=A0A4D5RCD7_IXOSC